MDVLKFCVIGITDTFASSFENFPEKLSILSVLFAVFVFRFSEECFGLLEILIYHDSSSIQKNLAAFVSFLQNYW